MVVINQRQRPLVPVYSGGVSGDYSGLNRYIPMKGACANTASGQSTEITHSASIAVYRPQAEFSGGRIDDKLFWSDLSRLLLSFNNSIYLEA